MPQDPFRPSYTHNLSVSSTTARQDIDDDLTAVRIYNSHSEPIFVKFGDSDVEAAVTDMAIASGVTEVFDKGQATHMAVITASGSATINITLGEGI